MIIGCGDDEGGDSAEDGGVTPTDLNEVNDAIDQLETELGDLTDGLDGLDTEVNDLTESLDSLKDDVEGRLEDLENPEILSCSESEVCIPDGIGLTTEGIADIIQTVCEHEMDCCTETELNLKFGPGVQSVDDCVNLFNDMVENGFSPDFFYSYLTPNIVYQVIGVAQALNDPRVHVEIDEEGVQECLDSLDTECPEIAEPGEEPEPECVVPEEYEEDPCSLDNLLNGLQEEGELCGDYTYGEGEAIPECMDGFYCSFEGYTNSEQGLCAKLPEEGDGCQEDYQCDPWGYYGYYNGPMATNLYCNLTSATCEPLGAEGDECEFIDDTFTIVDQSNYLYPTNRSATSRDCRWGLTCDPSSNECVANCSEGRFCQNTRNPLSNCEEGLVCNITEIPELYDNYGFGFCDEAIDDGDTCTAFGYECSSGKCAEMCDEDGLCECSVVKQPGDECDAPGYDPECSTEWCGTNSECVEPCNCDENIEGSCDFVEGPEPVSCADGYYCDPGSSTYTNGVYAYACEPLIANSADCDYGFDENWHVPCNSGFCNAGVCAAKVAASAGCPTGVDEQCPNSQYCSTDEVPICLTYLGDGGNCDKTDLSGLQCAKGLVCVDGTNSDACRPLAESGETCDPGAIGAPSCNDTEDPNMQCVDVDGAAGGTVLKCYSSDGGYADGVECYFTDSYCASGWCRPDAPINAMASACAQPLPEGDDCDTSDQTLDVCAEGLYCKNSRDSTMGKCAEQQGPGGSCDPFFAGNDCIAGGNCYFTKDQYLCDQYSVDYVTDIFCGGN